MEDKTLDEAKFDAEIFVNSAGIAEDEAEETIVMLTIFGAGQRLEATNKALEWAAAWILSAGEASAEPRTKEFAENMAMSIRAGMLSHYN